MSCQKAAPRQYITETFSSCENFYQSDLIVYKKEQKTLIKFSDYQIIVICDVSELQKFEESENQIFV